MEILDAVGKTWYFIEGMVEVLSDILLSSIYPVYFYSKIKNASLLSILTASQLIEIKNVQGA
ncbi:MAG: hypothetical protein M0Z77_08710 [Thermoplasmatales archaeon]|nr:hypothetical protein [Thermoplasmatales archaeon]